ncbi:hypothetical protein [Methanomassiliicoccus luminyensis]|uniref:hypothetical protein n=1 Tax=Methanomassiliicoccus luminyensis TaxID=1080712 RepID=UPI00035C24E3|nr:hypothetical protein [Methanomassiliicoccus luminyensis]
MFHPERDLREIIYEILKADGKSISALSRDLEAQGISIHRLILTGYLRALTDLNILKEKDVPPAKVYVPARPKEKDVYEIIGDGSRKVAGGTEADKLALYALGKLFRRPIFIDELRRAGVRDPVGRQASPEERADAKKTLQKSGMKVPDSSPAFVAEDNGAPGKFEDLLSATIIELLDVSFLVRETKQTKLLKDGM